MKNKLLIFLFLFSSDLFSQNAWTIYNTSNSPLPFNAVNCISFDQNGVKWIGTEFGLASYDNAAWTIYNTSNSGLPDNAIRCVAIDSMNNKWVGTYLGGLAKYDGTNWTIFNSLNTILPDNFIKSLAFDTLGYLWVGTVSGLAVYDGTDWSLLDISNSPFELSDNIATINIDSTNVFRIGTLNGGFIKIINNNWTVYTIPNGSGIPDNTQLDIEVDDNGLEWFTTPSNGLVAHPGGTSWFVYNQFTSLMPSSATTSLVTLSNPERIWVGTFDAGIVRKTGTNFTGFDPSNSPMPDYYISCIEKASDGIIWIGTQSGGLVKLDESFLTGISEVSSVAQPIVFPQPVKNQINVFYPYSKIKNIAVIDLTGKHVGVSYNETAVANYQVNLPSLSAGIYFLQLTAADNKVLTKKIVKIN